MKRIEKNKIKRRKKIRNGILVFVLLFILLFAIKLINRYLIRRVETEVETTQEETEEEYESGENFYKSKDLEIQITKHEEGEGEEKLTYFVADIKLNDARRFKRAFANNQFGTNIVDFPIDMANNNNAIIAINGDYYGFRETGVVISDGICYRNNPARELLAYYQDGRMEIIDETKVTAEEMIQNGVVNTFSFGPTLVKDHQVVIDVEKYAVDGDNIIKNNIATENPRTGIGYYDKNHYCFVVVDGRKEGYSKGVTLNEYAKIFQDLGCELAYNLDGGNSSILMFMGKIVNQPSGGGQRVVSDIIYIY